MRNTQALRRPQYPAVLSTAVWLGFDGCVGRRNGSSGEAAVWGDGLESIRELAQSFGVTVQMGG